MKKYTSDFFTFLGVFMIVFLASNAAYAAGDTTSIAKQAKLIIDRFKPIVFIAAAGFLVWEGISALINGGKEGKDFVKVVSQIALALGIFLIAGAIVNVFVPSGSEVTFATTAS